jgi:hypothetical protein
MSVYKDWIITELILETKLLILLKHSSQTVTELEELDSRVCIALSSRWLEEY